MKVLIDTSSLIHRCLSAGTDAENGTAVEHNDKVVIVPSAQYGIDNAINSLNTFLTKTGLHPANLIFVVESGKTRSMRQAIYPEYKGKRASRPEGYYPSFKTATDVIINSYCARGAKWVTVPDIEADDVIAYMCCGADSKIVLSEDGDLCTLIAPNVSVWRKAELTKTNPYGEFPPDCIPLYKALVGDSSDNIPGIKGFGPKAWETLVSQLVNPHGVSMIPILNKMVKAEKIGELRDDVAQFPILSKVVDNEEVVRTMYRLTSLHPEWVRPQPMLKSVLIADTGDPRIDQWKTALPQKKQKVVFDTEIMGPVDNAVFLCCTKNLDTGETDSFWYHISGDMSRLNRMLDNPLYTWIGFNSRNFDAAMVAMATQGFSIASIKEACSEIVGGLNYFAAMKKWGFNSLDIDHIDLIEVAPGVMISLKTYAARMHMKDLVDLPFEHDHPLHKDDLPILEHYCFHDLEVTEALYRRLVGQISLREEVGAKYNLDLRSKSDAQIAESVFRSRLGIKKPQDADLPKRVSYVAPDYIRNSPALDGSEELAELLGRIESADYIIDQKTGAPIAPKFMTETFALNDGLYKVGIGGLHSKHDVSVSYNADDDYLVSDFDVASYYPSLILKSGLTPHLQGRGEQFMGIYRDFYNDRLAAKASGEKVLADTYKIVLNGTFGKLGSIYSVMYAPELLLAVTLTGQLNLLALIWELETIPSVSVLSANTDGVMVRYRKAVRDKVLAKVEDNSRRTSFIYEETAYRKVALRDVNNYFAVKPNGSLKRKGVFAIPDLTKNPTMQVVSDAVAKYLSDGACITTSIRSETDFRKFLAVRNVKGGGVQHTDKVVTDPWVCEWQNPRKSGRSLWIDPTRPLSEPVFEEAPDNSGPFEIRHEYQLKRNRPDPVVTYTGGTPFGRIARWYHTTKETNPITYVKSGNKVPSTDGAMICLTLPDSIPSDLDYDWYVKKAFEVLKEIGVEV